MLSTRGVVGVVEVRVVDVDGVDAEAGQRGVDGGPDRFGGHAGELRVVTYFGGDHELVAVAAAGQPFADDGFGLAAGVALGPERVGVGGVQEVPTGSDVAVEDCVRGCGVGGPAEDVGAERQWGYGDSWGDGPLGDQGLPPSDVYVWDGGVGPSCGCTREGGSYSAWLSRVPCAQLGGGACVMRLRRRDWRSAAFRPMPRAGCRGRRRR